MNFNWRPGAVWLEHTGETAAVAAAATALSLITPSGGIHWTVVAGLSAKAALYAALYAVVGLRERNGTASLNPRVVAKNKSAPADD